jgi:hypothetical protein
MLNAIFDAVSKAQPARGNVAMNHFLQAGFVDRYMTALQRVDLSLVVVNADNIMANIGEASTRHQADIP